MYLYQTGSARWDERKEGGWKDRMDDWKMQQGNLGPETDDANDPDMAMYWPKLFSIVLQTVTNCAKLLLI